MKRVAIYARYSSDNQKDSSIEDQVRLCRERAEKEGWQIENILRGDNQGEIQRQSG